MEQMPSLYFAFMLKFAFQYVFVHVILDISTYLLFCAIISCLILPPDRLSLWLVCRCGILCQTTCAILALAETNTDNI